MKNSEYWAQRFVQLEKAQHEFANTAVSKIDKMYQNAIDDIERKVLKWYQRLADNNKITLAEAKRFLVGSDLKEFKWDVKDYIAYAEENALDGKWAKELENASAKFHISKLEALKIHVRQSLEVLFSAQFGTIDSTLKNVYKSGYYKTAYELQKGFNIGFDIAGVDQSQIEKIIAKPWAPDGYNFSERIWKNKNQLINTIHNEITQNILTGADPQKAINAIAKKMNTSKFNAGRLVMTEEAYFSSAAQKDCFSELGVEQYEIVATLDTHTSDICRNLDGKHYPMSEYKAGVTAPPFHVYCRSTTAPYFDDDFGQIGQRAARNENGKTYYVPDNMTYAEWQKAFINGDKSGLTNAENGDIIKEKNNKPITPISDKAIERVPKVDISGYSDEQCEFIQQQHKELLKYSRENNECKETAFVFRKGLTDKSEFLGSDDKLDFGTALANKGSELFIMHNHPRNSSFSLNDVLLFKDFDDLKTLSIVKNNGDVECITKLYDFNSKTFDIEFNRLYKKIVKNETNIEIDKFISTLFKVTKAGVIFYGRK